MTRPLRRARSATRALVLLILVVGLWFTPGENVAEPGGDPGEMTSPTPNSTPPPTPNSTPPPSPTSTTPLVPEIVSGDAPAAPPVLAPEPPSGDERKITRAAQIWLRSFTPDRTRAALVEKLEGLGAYVQSSSGDVVELRVPSEALEMALTLFAAEEVLNRQVSSEDVSLEWLTLNSRVSVLRESRGRIKSMLRDAARVDDSLLIENDLNQVTRELEQALGRKRFLAERLARVPLSLTVSMKAPPHDRAINRVNPFPWVESYGLEGLISSN